MPLTRREGVKISPLEMVKKIVACTRSVLEMDISKYEYALRPYLLVIQRNEYLPRYLYFPTRSESIGDSELSKCHVYCMRYSRALQSRRANLILLPTPLVKEVVFLKDLKV